MPDIFPCSVLYALLDQRYMNINSVLATELMAGYKATGYSSMGDAIADIGTQVATLVVDGPITLTTAETIPSTMTLKITRPGLITIFGAGSLAFASGATIDCGDGSYQVFGGTCAVTGLKWATPDMFGGGTGGVGYAIAAAKTVELLAGNTYTSSSISYDGDINLVGKGTLKHSSSSSTPLISTTSHVFNVKDITIDGNQAGQSNRFPTILATGSTSGLWDNVTVINGNGVSEATTNGRAAVTFVDCSNITIRDCNMSACYLSALMFKRLNGSVTEAYGNNVSGGSYTNNGGSGIVTYLANDVTVSGVTATSNGTAASSSGISINGIRNKVSHCASRMNTSAGINVGHGVDADLNASGSVVTDNVVTNNDYSGITILGDNDVVQSGILIANNYIDNNTIAGIISPQYSKKLTIIGNKVRNEPVGIRIFGEQHLIEGNDLGETNTSPIAVAASDDYVGQDMLLRNNVLQGSTQSYVHFENNGSATTKGVTSDGYLKRISPNATLTGSTTKTLQFSIPLRAWNVFGGATKFVVRASGLKTGSSNKTIRLEMGAAGSGVGIINQVVTTTNAWDFVTTVQIVSANIGHIQTQVWDGVTKSTDTFGTQTFGVNFGDDFYIELYFTLADGADSITLTNYSIEIVR